MLLLIILVHPESRKYSIRGLFQYVVIRTMPGLDSLLLSRPIQIGMEHIPLLMHPLRWTHMPVQLSLPLEAALFHLEVSLGFGLTAAYCRLP